MNKSLKTRLILFFLSVATSVFIGTGIFSWFEAKDQMDEFFDTYQLLFAKQLASTDWSELNKNTQELANKVIKSIKNDGKEDDDALGFAVFSNDGKMIFNDNENGKHFKYNNNPDGFMKQKIKRDIFRIIWVRSTDNKFVIAVGQELDFRQEAAFEVTMAAIIPWGFGLVILLFFCIFFINKELKSINKVANEIGSRSPEDLTPVNYDNIPSEITPLLASINSLFTRVREMIIKEKNFISDAAHEMRSPLAALKVQAEVAMISNGDEATRNKALKNIEIGVDRLTHLFEQLLALSISEAAHDAVIEDIELYEIASEIVSEYSKEIKDKELAIEINGKKIEKGQSILWKLLVKNLIDNAIKYGTPNTLISIYLNNDELIFTNQSHLISSDVIEKLGERFYRPAGQKEKGSGLGLSIVKRIAKIYNHSVKFSNSDQKFTVSISKINNTK